MIQILAVLCVLLFCFSCFQVFAYGRLKAKLLASVEELRASKASPPAVPKYDVSAQDLIHDMTRRGHAIVRMEILDPSALLLRSPRE